jgi:hypothetical protein
VFEYVEAFDNRQRRHSTLNMLPEPPTNNNDSRRSTVEINHSNNNNQQTNPVSRKPGQVHGVRDRIHANSAAPHRVC